VLPKLGLFTARELSLLHEDPEGTKVALDQLNEELHQHGLHVNTHQLQTQVREERGPIVQPMVMGTATMGGVSLQMTVLWCEPVTSGPLPVENTKARSLQNTTDKPETERRRRQIRRSLEGTYAASETRTTSEPRPNYV
jgi:hypothetical protein